MTIQQIYDLAVKFGIKNDPRSEKRVEEILAKTKNDLDKLSEKDKIYFDKETLKNPYSDSRILFGDGQTEVKKIFAGIDADTAEVLLVDRLNQKGANIDLLISHHPNGAALASLHDVMDLQTESFAKAGVPINVMDSLMNERMSFIMRRIHPSNHSAPVDAARLLNVPLMALHTIWDNIGDKFMADYLDKKNFETVGAIMDYLMEIPEYMESKKGKNGPEIVSGSARSRTGKIAVFFTGGTNPSKEAYLELAKAGVGTLIDMHVPEDGLDELKKAHVNVINAGHMASDSIGANFFLDELEKNGIEVMSGAGLIRVKRSK